VRIVALTCLVVPQALVLLVQGVAPLLLHQAPLVLLALHPFEPWSLLVSTRTHLIPFLAIVITARAVPCCGDSLLGRWYGPRAVGWLSRRPRPGARRLAEKLQRLSPRAAGALLLLYPGATASVLAGVNGLAPRRFLVLMPTGIVLAAVTTRVLAAAAAGPLTAAAAALDRWAVPAGVLLLLLVVVVELRPRRQQDR
jgi:hypothetical protein